MAAAVWCAHLAVRTVITDSNRSTGRLRASTRFEQLKHLLWRSRVRVGMAESVPQIDERVEVRPGWDSFVETRGTAKRCYGPPFPADGEAVEPCRHHHAPLEVRSEPVGDLVDRRLGHEGGVHHDARDTVVVVVVALRIRS